MARTYKKQSVVSGLKISDILKMPETQFKQYSVSDQRKIVGRLVSAGNKRLKAFERKGDSSPAVYEVLESGGKFSTRGKDESELLKEMNRARSFMRQEISKVSVWKKTREKVLKGLREKREIYLNESQVTDVMRLVNIVRANRPLTREERYALIKQGILELRKGEESIEEIGRRLSQEMDELYKQSQEDYINATSVSDFFTVK